MAYALKSVRPLIPSNRDNFVRTSVSQLVFVNGWEHPPTGGIVGTVAGFKYKLPPLNFTRPVVAFRAITASRMAKTQTIGASAFVIPGSYSAWYITLKDQTGKVLCDRAPLFQFAFTAGGGLANGWQRRFNNVMIDPLQSYLVCTADNQLHIVALEFLFR